MSENGVDFQLRDVQVPILFEGELKCGRQLGKGTFCNVLSVEQVHLNESNESRCSFLEEERPRLLRRKLAKAFERAPSKKDRNLAIYGKPLVDDPSQPPPPRMALKRLRDDLPSSRLPIGKDDLQRELEILLEVSGSGSDESRRHPNILELYAIGITSDSGGEDSMWQGSTSTIPSNPSYFLLLNRIRTTLPSFLNKWRDERGIGIYETFAADMTGFRTLWVERLIFLTRVTSALAFLHKHRILYRDLKADNIGFAGDVGNDVPKIFDFGLAKRIRPANARLSDDFQLTADTGTARYMAPEVALGKRYGFSADVYSQSILMYEVVSLKTPFASVPPSVFIETVMVDGLRPPLEEYWPTAIQELLVSMWDETNSKRPLMETVSSTLEQLLRGSDEELYPKHLVKSRRRRSLLF